LFKIDKEKHTLVFTTPLSVENCIEKINCSVKSKEKGFYYLHGKANLSGFRIYDRSGMRNSFIREFCGRFISNADGSTRIKGEFKLHKAVKVFMTIWNVMLFAFFVMIVAFYDPVLSGPIDNHIWIVFIAMLAIEFVLIKVGTIFSKPNEKNVLEFIEHELLAIVAENGI